MRPLQILPNASTLSGRSKLDRLDLDTLFLIRLTLAMSRAPERQHHGHEVRRLHRMLGGTVATLTLRNGSPGGREHENCCARIARVCH